MPISTITGLSFSYIFSLSGLHPLELMSHSRMDFVGLYFLQLALIGKLISTLSDQVQAFEFVWKCKYCYVEDYTRLLCTIFVTHFQLVQMEVSLKWLRFGLFFLFFFGQSWIIIRLLAVSKYISGSVWTGWRSKIIDWMCKMHCNAPPDRCKNTISEKCVWNNERTVESNMLPHRRWKHCHWQLDRSAQIGRLVGFLVPQRRMHVFYFPSDL